MFDNIFIDECRPVRKSKAGAKQTHGLSYTRIYRIWKAMNHRCTYKSIPNYSSYGGKGIKVCERWASVTAFVEDMGPTYFPSATIDRIDNDKDYCPENCRWSTMKEQQRHRSNNNRITFDGETKCLSEWAESLKCPINVLAKRVTTYGAYKAIAITKSLPENGRLTRDQYIIQGEKHPDCTVKDSKVSNIIELLLEGKSRSEIAKKTGLKYFYICKIQTGRIRKKVRPDVPRPIKSKLDQSAKISTLELKPAQLHFEKKESTV